TPPAGSLEAEIAQALEAGSAALADGDLNRAAQFYGMVLQNSAENAPALIGMSRVLLAGGNVEQARAALDMGPDADRPGEAYESAAAAWRRQTAGSDLGAAAELEARTARDPDDHQARYDLAIVHNGAGRRREAAEVLLDSLRRDRSWNEEAARKKLLELF